MGLYLFDAPHTCLTNFMWSFFLAWILALTGAGAGTSWWILFVGLAVVCLHKLVPTYEFGAANVFCRWFGGLMGKIENGASHQEFLFTIGFQFGGALVGGILYNWIYDQAPQLIPNVAILTKVEGKIFMLSAFANFLQAYFYNRLVVSDTSLDNSLRLSTGLMLTWVLCQMSFAGSIGGITIDLGREIAAKIVHSDMVMDDYFKKFWLLIVGPLAGWGTCILYQALEYMLKAKQDGSCKKEDAPAAEQPADNNAEENA